MSELNPITVDILPVEVLLMIFEHLGAQDLLNCEVVCRRWRMALGPGPFWRLAFHKQIETSRIWRKVAHGMEWSYVNTRHFKEIYKVFKNCVKEIDKNWRTLDFSPYVVSNDDTDDDVDEDFNDDFNDNIDWHYMTVDDDYCASLNMYGNEVRYFELPSLEVSQNFKIDDSQVMQLLKDHVITLDRKKIKIYDSHTGELMREFLDEEWEYTDVWLNNGLLAALSVKPQTKGSRLSLWEFKNPLETTLLKEWTYDESHSDLMVDDLYIFTETEVYYSDPAYVGYLYQTRPWRRVAHFICSKTLETVRTMSFVDKHLHYEQGLVIVYDKKRVRILHVASGNYFNDLNTEGLGSSLRFCFNSKYLAAVSTDNDVFKVNLYDTKSRNPSIDCEIPLLASVEIPPTMFQLKFIQTQSMAMWMDETRLICHATPRHRSTPRELFILDFAATPVFVAEFHSSFILTYK